ARAVVKFFSELFGLDESMFRPVGYGETRPVATNNTAEGRKLNRRVTIRIRASAWE
ncbi:MAG TPA: porin, partial [bacterium]|nr:porin [bacterium]